MKFNGATFNKAQQDQLKKKVGAELDSVYARMLNYTGDWATDNEYHENDVVTYNGNLYEVIKAHTSSSTIDPNNSEYYKAMTAAKYIKHTLNMGTTEGRSALINIAKKGTSDGKRIFVVTGTRIMPLYNTGGLTQFVDILVDVNGASFLGVLIEAIVVGSSSATKRTAQIRESEVTLNTESLSGILTVYEEV